jgi:protein involved in polysaccharide export with SLBB domain
MNRSKWWSRSTYLMAAVLLGAAGSLALAQSPATDGARPDATRAELEAMAAEAERVASSASTSGSARTAKRAEASAIRERLANGDLRVGDRFVVRVTLDSAARGDTILVRDSLIVTILTLPDVSLQGVLRSELQEKIEAHVKRYIRQPVVRVNPLTRVSVVGAVVRPGFYFLDPERLLTDAIMAAGGPAANADLERLTVRRNGQEYVGQKNARQALREGRTLDQIRIRSGDVIDVGKKKERDWGSIAQIGLLVISAVLAVIGILRQAYQD